MFRDVPLAVKWFKMYRFEREKARRACRRPINFLFRLNARRWDCNGRKFIPRLSLSLSLALSGYRTTATLLLASAPERDTSQHTRLLQRRFIESLNYFSAPSRRRNGEWRKGDKWEAAGAGVERDFLVKRMRLPYMPRPPSAYRVENRCPATRNDFPRTDSKRNRCGFDRRVPAS